MDNEFILRWLTEFGFDKEVDWQLLSTKEWSHTVIWKNAVYEGYMKEDMRKGTLKLTQQAIQQLTKEF